MSFELSKSVSLDDLLRNASRELEQRVQQGDATAVETILAAYPQLADCSDTRLELIYTEHILRQESGRELSVADWIGRFPHWEQELRELFQVHEYLSGELVPAARPSAHRLEPGLPTTDRSGQSLARIGNYELLEPIGRGGMGVVYRARQVGLGRIVAVKSIPWYATAHPGVLARFRSEAAAVAKLQHPHIVQIFEVGWHDDVPFFSMEYVAGGNLARLIRERPLPARTAAQVLECLARAVHYAHTQGVVHRDLKPANVLLAPSLRPEAIQLPDAVPRAAPHEPASSERFDPKITDFGLAKQIDSQVTNTLEGAALGTPSYMAPEQTAMQVDAIGPSCDVYGLGAVLYDMLIGRPPFHAANVLETIDQVRTVEPIAPRSLQPNVPRDLETICLKCLQKDPLRRYASAAELADDLGRFLRSEPILARPIHPIERAFRWCLRNAKVATLLGLLSLVVVLGVVAVTWQWYRAEENARQLAEERDSAQQERARSERHLDRARTAVKQLTELGVSLLYTPGMQSSGQSVLERVVAFDEGFLEDDSSDPAVRLKTARANIRLARTCFLLGDWSKSEQAFVRGEQLLTELLRQDNADQAAAKLLASCHLFHGHLWQNTGRRDLALNAYLKARRILDQCAAVASLTPADQISYSNILLNYAQLLVLATPHEELELLFQQAIQMSTAAVTAQPDSAVYQDELALGLDTYGVFCYRVGRLAEAESLVRRAIEVHQQQHTGGRATPESQQYRARSYANLGRILAAEQQAEPAEQAFREGLRILQQMVRDFPQAYNYRRELADQLWEFAKLVNSPQRRDEAFELRHQAIQQYEQLVAHDPQNVDFQSALAQLLHNHANELRAVERMRDAREAYERAMEIMGKLVERPHASGDQQVAYANLILNYVLVLEPAEREQDLEKWCQRAVELDEAALASEPNNRVYRLQHALALESLGVYHWERQHWAQAEPLFEQSWQIRRAEHDIPPVDRADELMLARSEMNRARIFVATERTSESQRAYRESIRWLRGLVDDFPENSTYRQALAEQQLEIQNVLDRSSQSDEMRQLCREAIDNFRRLLHEFPEVPYYAQQLLIAIERAIAVSVDDPRRPEWVTMIAPVVDDLSRAASAGQLSGDRLSARLNQLNQLTATLIDLGASSAIVRDAYRRAWQLNPDSPAANNRLAWWLATCPDVADRDPVEAVVRAQFAAERVPDQANYFNTLGVAYYRAGDLPAAVSTLRRAGELRGSPDAWDLFFLAMTHAQLAEPELASERLQQASALMEQHAPKSAELARIRAEAERIVAAGVDAAPIESESGTP